MDFETRIQRLPMFLGFSAVWVPVFWVGALEVIAGAIRGPYTDAFRLAAAPLALAFGNLVWVGGDHMPGARFMVPLLPFSLLAILAFVARMKSGPARAWGTGAAVLSLVVGALQPPESLDGAALFGRMAARIINAEWPPGSLIALHTAGSTPFYVRDMHFIDMLGLVDPVIAHRRDVEIHPAAAYQTLPGHSKGDGAYVLSRRPDFIIAGPALGTTVGFHWFLSDVELGQSAEFHACYEPVIGTTELPEDLRWRHLDVEQTHDWIYYRRVSD